MFLLDHTHSVWHCFIGSSWLHLIWRLAAGTCLAVIAHASRSRSPAQTLTAGNLPVGHWSGSLSEWGGHFEGHVRPFRNGFVLGVTDALVEVPWRLRGGSAEDLGALRGVVERSVSAR